MTRTSILLSSYGSLSPAKDTTAFLLSQSQSKLSNKSDSIEMYIRQILKCKGQTIKVKMIFCFNDFLHKDPKLTKEVRTARSEKSFDQLLSKTLLGWRGRETRC